MDAETRDKIAMLRNLVDIKDCSVLLQRTAREVCDQLEAALAAGTFAEGVEAAKVAAQVYIASTPCIIWDVLSNRLDQLKNIKFSRALAPKETTAMEPQSKSTYICAQCGFEGTFNQCMDHGVDNDCKPTSEPAQPTMGDDPLDLKSEPTPAPASVQSEPIVESVTLVDGKYEFYRDGYILKCRRYGTEWRDFIGDNAVNALFDYALSKLATAPPAANVGLALTKEADIFWEADNEDQSYGDPADIIDARGVGEIVEIERAKKLPNIFGFATEDANRKLVEHYFATQEEAESALPIAPEKGRAVADTSERCGAYAEYQSSGVGCLLPKRHEGYHKGDELDLLTPNDTGKRTTGGRDEAREQASQGSGGIR